MFKRFFKKKKERDLFDELISLDEENKMKLEHAVRALQKKMFSEEGYEKLLNYSENLRTQISQFHSLRIDSLGWKKEADNQNGTSFYSNESGDFMSLDQLTPSGVLIKDNPSEINVYRNWIRQRFVNMGGGVISCEEYKKENSFDAYESITKIPRGQDKTGIDYVYFLNIRNYEEQKLYQIHIKIHEKGTTGLRDNVIMFPLADFLNIDMGELSQKYRKDPYDKNFEGGNRRNLSELEGFDYLFPFHPLSIIRREIRPQILKSVSFD